jgi:hypothetical protein
MAIIPVVVGFQHIPVGGTWVAPGTGYSNEASQFFNRITDPGTTRKSLYAAMIDGLVADGVWSLLDALYIFAADISANGLANLKSSSFGLTSNGAMTFTANVGYQSNNVGTSNLDTGFVPSTAGGQFALNSASLGVYSLTASTTSGATNDAIGCVDTGAAHRSFFNPNNGGNTFEGINQDSGQGIGSNTQHQGMWVLTRTTSALTTCYKNGTSIGTDPLNTASSALPNRSIMIFARNNTTPDPYADQMSAGFIGGGLNATQASNLSSRINTYMTSLGINVY